MSFPVAFSSLGGIGSTAFTLIINAPELAILGVSHTATRQVWNGREFAPRPKLRLALSYDHRALDGAVAAHFTAYLASVLSDIRRTLLYRHRRRGAAAARREHVLASSERDQSQVLRASRSLATNPNNSG
jgi:hypothetical protein